MPEFKIKRTGPNPMDCEVTVHPSDTDEHVIKVREALKNTGIEIKGVQCKSSNTPLSEKDILESIGALDSLSVFETPEEQAFRENSCGPVQPLQWFCGNEPMPVRCPESSPGFIHDMDVNSSYMYLYLPYSLIWDIRCDYRVFKERGVFMIHVVVSSQDKHNRRLRQLKKKMAHTKAINRQAVRDEYKATIAMRKQFQKHINNGLSIRDEDNLELIQGSNAITTNPSQ